MILGSNAHPYSPARKIPAANNRHIGNNPAQ